MDVDERIREYMGNTWTKSFGEFKISGLDRYDKNDHPKIFCFNDFQKDPYACIQPQTRTTYYHDMARYVYPHPSLHPQRFFFCPRDRVEPFPVPTLVKSRPINNYYHSILMNLNVERHFGTLSGLHDKDIPFTQKKDVLVWRGNDTGYGFGNHIPPRFVSRETLVARHASSSSPFLDIGLSDVKEENKDVYGAHMRPKLSLMNQLEHKFILSVEGNDVATNLKWILYSNSVPFCPPFEMESWILESRLEPWVHYIPVHHEFTDLDDKVEWAINHPSQCQEVAQNGKSYISQFLNLKTENHIIHQILHNYSQKITIVP